MKDNRFIEKNIFSYDTDEKVITITTSDTILLKGGRWKRGAYNFPLNTTNIDLLFKYHKHGKLRNGKENYWKPSLVRAMEKYTKSRIHMAASYNFLRKLTIAEIDKYPAVLPEDKQYPPFKNQKIFQYWQKYVNHHALLWQMGPLAGDTPLITDKGIVELKDYKDELVANPEGLHKSTELIEKTATELIEVETYHGMKITGTPEHEIKTLLGTKTFAELIVGNNLLIGFPNVFPEQSLVTDGYARALGMMMAEGTCNQPQIEFNLKGNEDLIEDIRNELKPQGETTRIVGGKQTWRAWWSIATVRETKGNHFPEEYSKNGFKIIPQKILQANKRTQIQFLYGYFRGDGTIGNRKGNFNFKLTERDEDIINYVQLLLFNMGIVTKRYKYIDVNAFNLTAPHSETTKMMELGLIDKINHRKTLNYGRYGKGEKGNNGRGYRYIDNHLISKIVSIKRYPTNEKVYCLRMANKHHWFYGNGITVHNTGKTRAIIDGYEVKKKAGKVKHCLVVCPVSMLEKWVDEVKKWSGNDSATALLGSKANKLELLDYDWEWIVTNYETLPGIKKELFKLIDDNWMIVLDEFTKIKNPTATRTRTCVELGKLSKHKYILSGTPITQHAYDLFAPFLFLDCGETFGLNYENFVTKYFWSSGYKKIAMRGSLEKISAKMYNNSTRFRKAECIDIPDKLYDTRILELPKRNKEKYSEMVQWAITQIEGSGKVTAPVILTQLLRLSQITSGFVKDEIGQTIDFKEQPKLNALQDIIESCNGSKMITWVRFKHDVDKIAELCDKMNIKCFKLYSDTPQSERTQGIKDFQTDKETKMLIGTAGTGGHGIDLTAASIVVYYSNSYSLEQRLQSEDRAHRAGQKNQVTYIDLLCKNTIDLAIYKILRGKKNIADIVTRDNIFQLIKG